MKKLFTCILFGSLVTLTFSCASTNHQVADARLRFHEAATANVILRFNSWDYINMMQPDYRDDGFLHQIKRAELGAAFDRFSVRRDLAVVVIGRSYDPQMAELLIAWKAELAANGFKRAVVLRADGSSGVNGSMIVEDSQLLARAPAPPVQILTGR